MVLLISNSTTVRIKPPCAVVTLNLTVVDVTWNKDHNHKLRGYILTERVFAHYMDPLKLNHLVNQQWIAEAVISKFWEALFL